MKSASPPSRPLWCGMSGAASTRLEHDDEHPGRLPEPGRRATGHARGLCTGDPFHAGVGTHSIEKVRWEEDYAVQKSPTPGQPPLLIALKARIKGSAAGMEPPDSAVLRNGWFEYTPQQTIVSELRLTRSEFTADYDWCVDGRCQSMSTLIASDKGLTSARACYSFK